MLFTILYIIGIILAIMAAIEIAKLKGNLLLKILFIVLVLCTSWIGVAAYYLGLNKLIPGWVK